MCSVNTVRTRTAKMERINIIRVKIVLKNDSTEIE